MTPDRVTADAAKLVELRKERDRLNVELKDVNALIKVAEQGMMEHFEQGCEGITVDGYSIYPTRRTTIKVRGGDRSAVAAEMIANGMEELATFNTNSLTSAITNMEDAGVPLPEWLDSLVEVGEYYLVSCRKKG